MNVDEIERLAVVGVGEIGHQIAQEFAMAGYDVNLNDVTETHLRQALSNIERNLTMLSKHGFIDAQRIEPTMQRCHTHLAMKDAVEDVDIVVEAVYENVELKQQIFQRLDTLCPDRTILASNSSALMPRFMASATQRPEQVLVAHYINPPFLLPVVELVRCQETSEATMQTMVAFYRKIGKSPVVVQKEAPGFIVNRLQAALGREAYYIVEQGIASPQDVDTVIKDSFGRRLSVVGMIELMELIAGYDLSLIACNNMFPHLCSATEAPSIVKELVEKGNLGAKTGQGFYSWTPESADAFREKIMTALIEIAKWRTRVDTGTG
jgi:3-hydroxybutyryl-CoA dehydrogenase